MRIEDLPSAADRDHCLRAQKGKTIHEARAEDQYNNRIVRERPAGSFDARSEAEFQQGLQ